MTKRFDILTIFPELCQQVVECSIIGRAIKAGKLEVNCHNIRDFANNKWHKVDDTPYGGGKGMLMQADPIFNCYNHVIKDMEKKPYVIYMSPQGNVINQKKALELSEMDNNIMLLCGHYEGIDQRILDMIVDEEISIGDYVLTGGELAATVVVDAVGRLCPGVLSSEECFIDESHFSVLLEYPQYTKPAVWQGVEVPEVLRNGHHAKIVKWQHEMALVNTYNKRPDLLKTADLTKEDTAFLEDMEKMEKLKVDLHKKI